ncbi:MAG: shikimate kinase, partial [Ginsengibacter sp.]
PCFFDNLDWMKQHGKIIYLKASPEYILNRVMDETSKRPLLKEVNSAELLFFIQKKLQEREPVYLNANHILEVDKLKKDSLNFLEKKRKIKPTEDNKKKLIKKEPVKNKKIEKVIKSSSTVKNKKNKTK